MRHICLLLGLVWAGPVFAHPNHIAEVAGHDHWIAGAALGAAIALGLWGALKGRKKTRKETATDDEEAPA